MPNEAQKHTKKTIEHEVYAKTSQDDNRLNDNDTRLNHGKQNVPPNKSVEDRPNSDFEGAVKSGGKNSSEQLKEISQGKPEKDWRIDDVRDEEKSDIDDESYVDDEEDEEENSNDKNKDVPSLKLAGETEEDEEEDEDDDDDDEDDEEEEEIEEAQDEERSTVERDNLEETEDEPNKQVNAEVTTEGVTSNEDMENITEEDKEIRESYEKSNRNAMNG